MVKIFSYVTRADETSAKNDGFGPSSYIPTEGAIASAFDAYRTFEISHIENKPDSWSMLDVDSIAALGRVIDGPITSKEDLVMAEQALRAMLFHESTQVLVPSLKIDHGGFICYQRLDKGLRNSASYEALKVLDSRDLLFTTEYLEVSERIVTSSSNPRSGLINRSVESFGNGYELVLKSSSEVSITLPNRIGATTYFSNPELTKHCSTYESGFIKRLYDSIEKPWFEIAQASPPIEVDIKLPPLISIVFSRASYRDEIPDVIRQLREELIVSRKELVRFNSLIDEGLNQRDYMAQVNRIQDSFNAIVAESQLTDAEIIKRKILGVWNLIRPVANAYVASNFTLFNTLDEFMAVYQSMEDRVKKSSRIVSRNVPASTMSETLKVDNIFMSAKKILTESEMKLFSK